MSNKNNIRIILLTLGILFTLSANLIVPLKMQYDFTEEGDLTPKTSAQWLTPTLVGKIGDSYNKSRGVFVSRDIAYIGGMADGLEIINVSDPTNPILLGTYG